MSRLAWLLGGAVLLVAAVLAWARFAPMPPERAAALAVLTQPFPPVAGRDAADAFWLLGHDVPADQRARLALPKSSKEEASP